MISCSVITLQKAARSDQIVCIHLLMEQNVLLIAYVPGTGLGPREGAVNKTKLLCSWGFHPSGRTVNKYVINVRVVNDRRKNKADCG